MPRLMLLFFHARVNVVIVDNFFITCHKSCAPKGRSFTLCGSDDGRLRSGHVTPGLLKASQGSGLRSAGLTAWPDRPINYSVFFKL